MASESNQPTPYATSHATPELDRLRTMIGTLVGPELYGPILEGLPDALIIVDESGAVILVNQQAELLLGYHRSELLGNKIEMLVPVDVRNRHVRHREGFAADPRSRPMGVDLPLAARHKSGRDIPVRINLSPIVTSTGMYVAAVLRRREGADVKTGVGVGSGCPVEHGTGSG